MLVQCAQYASETDVLPFPSNYLGSLPSSTYKIL